MEHQEICQAFLLWILRDNASIKIERRIRILLNFFTKTTFVCLFLLGSGLKLIFHWKAHLMIWCKSLLIYFQKYQHRGLWKIKMHQFQNNYGFDYRASIKSLIKAKKRRATKIDLWETPASIPVHEETFPFKVTLCFLYLKKSDQTLSSLLQMSFCFSLNIIPLS